MKLVVLYSFILAVLHSILFYGQKLGVSVFLFTLVGLFFFIHLLQKADKIKNKKGLLISIPILILASTYFIFNNMLFNVLNILVILFLFLIMTLISILGQLHPGRLIENLFVLFLGPLEELPESFKEVKNCLTRNKNKENKNNKVSKQILKGLLITLPIALLVLFLLSSADEMFGIIFKNILKRIYELINMETLFNIVARIVIIFVLMLYFICMAIKIRKNQFVNTKPIFKNIINIDGITISTLLTVLNVIYLAFSIVQIMHIKAATISNYADFARAGFFQLITVSLINFIIILITKNNKKEIDSGIKKYEKVMNVLLAIFTIVILITSIYRMSIYEQAYGYTYLRLLVNFIQITELLLIIPTIIYIIKEKFDILKWYITIAVAVYIVVNFTNFDFIIAKGNIDRYFSMEKDKRDIDFYYIENNTSTDALIEVTRLLETDDENLKTLVNDYLYDSYMDLLNEDNTFQSFNISRKRTIEKLKELNLKRLNSYVIESRDYEETLYDEPFDLF